MRIRFSQAMATAIVTGTILSSSVAARPKLGVLIVFDQLRAVEVDRLAPLFGPGGFGGLMQGGGARFDARYPYAACETSPGHATLATGSAPSVHGVPVNSWWQDGRLIYSVLDDQHEVLGVPPGTSGRGPAQLRVGTLGDAMKVETGGQARVITLSLKDRAAILTGGYAADLALWFEPSIGRYTTSSAYASALPAWVEQLAPRVQRSIDSGAWEALPVPPGFEHLIPLDAQPGESTRHLGGPTFPHRWGEEPQASRRYGYRGTPGAIDDLFALAQAAIEAEALGADDVPDLLVISVSTTDFVGHWFGPMSVEMTDLLRRADQTLRSFLSDLEARFGRDGVVVAVTADHGATPLPERVAQHGARGARLAVKSLVSTVNTAIGAAVPDVPPQQRVASFYPPHLWLALDDLSGPQRERAIAAARAAIQGIPGIAATYLPSELESDPDPFAAKMRLSTYPGRTGTILVRQEPRVLMDFSDDETGTDHGTPYTYDSTVPLFVRGPGVRRGRYATVADPRDVAATLAFLLGVPAPDASQGAPLPAVEPIFSP